MQNPIPKLVLQSSFLGLRVPVEVAKRVTGNTANAAWGPELILDSVQATATKFTGALTGDQSLVARGRLLETSVQERRRAVDLEAEAERIRTEASAKLDAERTQATEQRERAER